MQASTTARCEINETGRIFQQGLAFSFCKRFIDFLGAAVLLLLTLPLLVAGAILIKAEDGGPVLHRRRVVGLHGTFDAFKLRSMRVDADEVLERDVELRRQFSINFKLKGDPRVTRVGALLRRFSIDELPQLWNVLRGEMSLVGPRMITAAELEKFGDSAWIFTCIKPGLTGYWQVEGSTARSYAERVRMELWYAENRSTALDLMILLRTPLRVLRGPETH